MKTVCFSLLAALLTVAWTSSVWGWQGRVVEIIDARTLLVETADRKVGVSLYGLGVPEDTEPFGEQALKALQEWALGQEVQMEGPPPPGSEVSGVVVVAQSGRNLNESLLKNGLAWVWEATCERAVLCGRWERLQGRAKAANNGFWTIVPENRPPWKWLREQGGQ